MSNELDIRIYSKQHNEYVDRIDAIYYFMKYVYGTVGCISLALKFDEVIFESFTGEVDKHNNKIYDGDVLCSEYSKYEVYYDDTYCSFMMRDMEDESTECLSEATLYNLEIMNTVHDNKKLVT